jgi:5-methyltetrahydrofolate--homocysteine methyltransferase
MIEVINEIYRGILDGQQAVVQEKVKVALLSGVSVRSILDEGMIAAMSEVGHLFEQGKYYIPEMLVSARAMKAGLALLKPSLNETNTQVVGKVAIGTVKGDLHDVGKNLVAIMLEGAGFEILDLGTDVAMHSFVQAADHVQVIALSALLTTTMWNMKEVMDGLQESGKRSMVKVIIGGAPVTGEFAQLIGADGFAPDASRAVSLVKSLLMIKE